MRALALFLMISFTVTSLSIPSAAAQAPVAPTIYPEKLDWKNFTIPKDLGEVLDISESGKDLPGVILIQDAHSVPDTQQKIYQLIEAVKSKYRVRRVALEGAPQGRLLDSQFLSHFPDRKKLKATVEAYLRNAEITGGTASAILDETGTEYAGVEDWQLYQEGLNLFLQAGENEQDLLERIKREEEGVRRRKREVYSKELLEIDTKLEGFYDNETGLLGILETLSTIQRPKAGSSLDILLQTSKNSPASAEIEIKKIAGEVQKKLRGFPKNAQSDVIRLNQAVQALRNSEIPVQAIARTLKNLIDQYELPILISSSLLRSAENQKSLDEIRGTKLYEEFEVYVSELFKNRLRSEDGRGLYQKSRVLKLLKAFSKLEISRAEWNEIKAMSLNSSWKTHLRFYKNTESRDRALFTNWMKFMNQEPTILVSGGFHTEGMSQRLKEAGISYAVIQAKIDELPEKTHYREHMQGNVSWKDYFEVKNGRVNLYEAFVRATRDRLLGYQMIRKSENQVPDALISRYPDILKHWRDQLIRDLAEQGRIEQAGQYTRYLDEITQGAERRAHGKKKSLDSRFALSAMRYASLAQRVEAFISGLKHLESTQQLNRINIQNLLKPAFAFSFTELRRGEPGTITAGWNSPAIAVPGTSLVGAGLRTDGKGKTKRRIKGDDAFVDKDHTGKRQERLEPRPQFLPDQLSSEESPFIKNPTSHVMIPNEAKESLILRANEVKKLLARADPKIMEETFNIERWIKSALVGVKKALRFIKRILSNISNIINNKLILIQITQVINWKWVRLIINPIPSFSNQNYRQELRNPQEELDEFLTPIFQPGTKENTDLMAFLKKHFTPFTQRKNLRPRSNVFSDSGISSASPQLDFMANTQKWNLNVMIESDSRSLLIIFGLSQQKNRPPLDQEEGQIARGFKIQLVDQEGKVLQGASFEKLLETKPEMTIGVAFSYERPDEKVLIEKYPGLRDGTLEGLHFELVKETPARIELRGIFGEHIWEQYPRHKIVVSSLESNQIKIEFFYPKLAGLFRLRKAVILKAGKKPGPYGFTGQAAEEFVAEALKTLQTFASIKCKGWIERFWELLPTPGVIGPWVKPAGFEERFTIVRVRTEHWQQKQQWKTASGDTSRRAELRTGLDELKDKVTQQLERHLEFRDPSSSDMLFMRVLWDFLRDKILPIGNHSEDLRGSKTLEKDIKFLVLMYAIEAAALQLWGKGFESLKSKAISGDLWQRQQVLFAAAIGSLIRLLVSDGATRHSENLNVTLTSGLPELIGGQGPTTWYHHPVTNLLDPERISKAENELLRFLQSQLGFPIRFTLPANPLQGSMWVVEERTTKGGREFPAIIIVDADGFHIFKVGDNFTMSFRSYYPGVLKMRWPDVAQRDIVPIADGSIRWTNSHVFQVQLRLDYFRTAASLEPGEPRRSEFRSRRELRQLTDDRYLEIWQILMMRAARSPFAKALLNMPLGSFVAYGQEYLRTKASDFPLTAARVSKEDMLLFLERADREGRPADLPAEAVALPTQTNVPDVAKQAKTVPVPRRTDLSMSKEANQSTSTPASPQNPWQPPPYVDTLLARAIDQSKEASSRKSEGLHNRNAPSQTKPATKKVEPSTPQDEDDEGETEKDLPQLSVEFAKQLPVIQDRIQYEIEALIQKIHDKLQKNEGPIKIMLDELEPPMKAIINFQGPRKELVKSNIEAMITAIQTVTKDERFAQNRQESKFPILEVRFSILHDQAQAVIANLDLLESWWVKTHKAILDQDEIPSLEELKNEKLAENLSSNAFGSNISRLELRAKKSEGDDLVADLVKATQYSTSMIGWPPNLSQSYKLAVIAIFEHDPRILVHDVNDRMETAMDIVLRYAAEDLDFEIALFEQDRDAKLKGKPVRDRLLERIAHWANATQRANRDILNSAVALLEENPWRKVTVDLWQREEQKYLFEVLLFYVNQLDAKGMVILRRAIEQVDPKLAELHRDKFSRRSAANHENLALSAPYLPPGSLNQTAKQAFANALKGSDTLHFRTVSDIASMRALLNEGIHYPYTWRNYQRHEIAKMAGKLESLIEKVNPHQEMSVVNNLAVKILQPMKEWLKGSGDLIALGSIQDAVSDLELTWEQNHYAKAVHLPRPLLTEITERIDQLSESIDKLLKIQFLENASPETWVPKRGFVKKAFLSLFKKGETWLTGFAALFTILLVTRWVKLDILSGKRPPLNWDAETISFLVTACAAFVAMVVGIFMVMIKNERMKSISDTQKKIESLKLALMRSDRMTEQLREQFAEFESPKPLPVSQDATHRLSPEPPAKRPTLEITESHSEKPNPASKDRTQQRERQEIRNVRRDYVGSGTYTNTFNRQSRGELRTVGQMEESKGEVERFELRKKLAGLFQDRKTFRERGQVVLRSDGSEGHSDKSHFFIDAVKTGFNLGSETLELSFKTSYFIFQPFKFAFESFKLASQVLQTFTEDTERALDVLKKHFKFPLAGEILVVWAIRFLSHGKRSLQRTMTSVNINLTKFINAKYEKLAVHPALLLLNEDFLDQPEFREELRTVSQPPSSSLPSQSFRPELRTNRDPFKLVSQSVETHPYWGFRTSIRRLQGEDLNELINQLTWNWWQKILRFFWREKTEFKWIRNIATILTRNHIMLPKSLRSLDRNGLNEIPLVTLLREILSEDSELGRPVPDPIGSRTSPSLTDRRAGGRRELRSNPLPPYRRVSVQEIAGLNNQLLHEKLIEIFISLEKELPANSITIPYAFSSNRRVLTYQIQNLIRDARQSLPREKYEPEMLLAKAEIFYELLRAEGVLWRTLPERATPFDDLKLQITKEIMMIFSPALYREADREEAFKRLAALQAEALFIYLPEPFSAALQDEMEINLRENIFGRIDFLHSHLPYLISIVMRKKDLIEDQLAQQSLTMLQAEGFESKFDKVWDRDAWYEMIARAQGRVGIQWELKANGRKEWIGIDTVREKSSTDLVSPPVYFTVEIDPRMQSILLKPVSDVHNPWTQTFFSQTLPDWLQAFNQSMQLRHGNQELRAEARNKAVEDFVWDDHSTKRPMPLWIKVLERVAYTGIGLLIGYYLAFRDMGYDLIQKKFIRPQPIPAAEEKQINSALKKIEETLRVERPETISKKAVEIAQDVALRAVYDEFLKAHVTAPTAVRKESLYLAWKILELSASKYGKKEIKVYEVENLSNEYKYQDFIDWLKPQLAQRGLLIEKERQEPPSPRNELRATPFDTAGAKAHEEEIVAALPKPKTKSQTKSEQKKGKRHELRTGDLLDPVDNGIAGRLSSDISSLMNREENAVQRFFKTLQGWPIHKLNGLEQRTFVIGADFILLSTFADGGWAIEVNRKSTGEKLQIFWMSTKTGERKRLWINGQDIREAIDEDPFAKLSFDYGNQRLGILFSQVLQPILEQEGVILETTLEPSAKRALGGWKIDFSKVSDRSLADGRLNAPPFVAQRPRAELRTEMRGVPVIHAKESELPSLLEKFLEPSAVLEIEEKSLSMQNLKAPDLRLVDSQNLGLFKVEIFDVNLKRTLENNRLAVESLKELRGFPRHAFQRLNQMRALVVKATEGESEAYLFGLIDEQTGVRVLFDIPLGLQKMTDRFYNADTFHLPFRLPLLNFDEEKRYAFDIAAAFMPVRGELRKQTAALGQKETAQPSHRRLGGVPYNSISSRDSKKSLHQEVSKNQALRLATTAVQPSESALPGRVELRSKENDVSAATQKVIRDILKGEAPERKHIGEFLHDYINLAQTYPRQVAKDAEMSEPMLSMILNEKALPSTKTVKRLAKVLNFDGTLFFRKIIRPIKERKGEYIKRDRKSLYKGQMSLTELGVPWKILQQLSQAEQPIASLREFKAFLSKSPEQLIHLLPNEEERRILFDVLMRSELRQVSAETKTARPISQPSGFRETYSSLPSASNAVNLAQENLNVNVHKKDAQRSSAADSLTDPALPGIEPGPRLSLEARSIQLSYRAGRGEDNNKMLINQVNIVNSRNKVESTAERAVNYISSRRGNLERVSEAIEKQIQHIGADKFGELLREAAAKMQSKEAADFIHWLADGSQKISGDIAIALDMSAGEKLNVVEALKKILGEETLHLFVTKPLADLSLPGVRVQPISNIEQLDIPGVIGFAVDNSEAVAVLEDQDLNLSSSSSVTYRIVGKNLPTNVDSHDARLMDKVLRLVIAKRLSFYIRKVSDLSGPAAQRGLAGASELDQLLLRAIQFHNQEVIVDVGFAYEIWQKIRAEQRTSASA